MMRFLKNEEGQAAVEFALIVPLLVTIVCGVIDMGWVFTNNYQVEQAAYAGARYAAINIADESKSENQVTQETEQRVRDNLGKNGSGAHITVDFGEDKVSVTVKCDIELLTYVGQTAFGGRYYNAEATDVAAR
jgi:Flp pilus assembly protein TadG